MLRTPHQTWWSLGNPKGHLSLTPSAETISGKGNPSFLARRLQHAKFEATTALSVPETVGVSAGLVAFQNESHYYYLGVKRTKDGLTLFLERSNGSAAEIVAQTPLSETKELELRLSGNQLIGEFSFKPHDGKWQTLAANADLTAITTNAAGGGMHFTGGVVGMHTRLEP